MTGNETPHVEPDQQDVFLLPMSFAQQRLWLLAQLEPLSAAYNIADGFRLRGELRPAALRCALDRLVERHETLRTTFAVVDGEPVQVVAAESRVRLPRVDLSALPEALREAEFHRLAVAEATRPFDLRRGPLFRPTLLRLAAGEHVLFATLHHLVTDGWSESVLARDLAALYGAEADGGDAGLEELPIQYGDYAQWQRESLQGEVYDDLVDWWKDRLAGFGDDVELPADRPRPTEPSYRGAVRTFDVDAAVAERLDALSREQGVTLYATLLAAFAVLLARHAGRRRVVIGSPVVNRGQVELEGLIGLFLNTLPLPVDLEGGPTFRELVERVGEVVLGAQEHQELPFERLVAELSPERDRSRNPFFQVLFNLENTPPSRPLEVAGVRLEPLQIDTRSAKLDLMLNLQRSPGRLRGSVEYSRDLFEAATVARWIGRFQLLLAAVAEDPDRTVDALPVLTAGDRRLLTEEWGTGPALGDAPPVELRVARHAGERASALAVRCGERELSYGELEAEANRLAHHLRDLGVGPEVPVALYLEPGPEVPLAMLAVLKAGGAFVPIDPQNPRRRVELLLEDAAPRVVVTTAAREEELGDVPVVRLDADAGVLAGRPARWRAEPPAPEHLAYVIYTSGSTGRPKGVMVSRGALAAYLAWAGDLYPVRDGGSLAHGSAAFDLALTALLLPLSAGATVEVLPGEAGPEELVRSLGSGRRYGFVKLTPSHLELLRRNLEPEAAGFAAALILGGEALFREQLALWREHALDTAVYNEYGPTEATVGCCVHRLDPGGASAGAAPIGRPSPGSRIYVLDRDLRPVPPGARGELFLGGAQVARGYRGRPRQTAERFVPDPLSATPGARLYRSGDLARYRPDGSLVYLGRTDEQLKVRGHRVEPGEVEAALLAHPDVGAAVAVGRDDGDGVRLVAYVTGDPAPDAAALREELRARLPEALVPSHVVVLDALPRTAGGKVDRRALPAPDPRAGGEGGELVAPRTPVEETLASIWSTVLELDRVGVTEDFFSLGGDSIRSLRVVALARQRGIALSMRQLNRHPTIAELAQQVAEGGAVEPDREPTRPFELLREEDRRDLPDWAEDAYPLARMQTGMLYHRERTPGAPLFHSINSHRLRMPLDEDRFQEAVLHVTRRHPNLRTSFDFTGYSEPLQIVHREAVFPVAFHDLRHLAEEERAYELEEYWRREQERPFDLSRPPQLRFALHRLDDASVQFTLTENHAIIDGWSLHLVLGEILRCYFSLLEDGTLPELPPLRTTFRDFVALEREAIDSAEHREFWQRRLAGYEPAPLPPASGGDAAGGPRVRRLDRILPPPVMRGLERLAREEAVPLKAVLLACHLRVMALLHGRRDVVTGLSSNGRLESMDGERVAGLFLNTLPMRVPMTGGSWRELVRRVHRLEMEHTPYRRYPLAEIQRRWGQESLFDTSFVYLNFHVIGEQMDSGELEYLETGAMVEETNFAIMTAFQHQPGHRDRVALSLCCDRWRLADGQIEAIAGYYLNTLRAMARQPEERYEAFSPLSAAERRRALDGAPAAGAEAGDGEPAVVPLIRRFEERAARHPERPCLAGGGRSLTYGEVDRRAAVLAGRLRRAGADAGTPVALLSTRSPEAVVGMLAAWKAGGAFLPLDPEQPDRHLESLLDAAGAVAVLAGVGLEERLKSLPVLPLAAADEPAVDAPAAVPVEPEQLAYLIYTSGSTGRPKGVAVEHRQLASYVEGAVERLELPPGGSYGLVSTFTADLGHTMIFPALATGGCLHVASDSEVRDSGALAAWASEGGVDCLKVVPSHLNALLAGDGAADLLPRRRLILGGEAADWALVERLRRLAPDCRLFNHYGPSETTVGVLATELAASEDGTAPAPPLGRPFGAARAYVLDPYLLPVPTGVAGEICVGGGTVARGYLGDPRRTALCFVPDPYAEGGRLYRTGDAARRRPDGQVEFLGRVDRQVKIRGHRVEPEQVEVVLRGHPDVRAACVIVQHDGDGPRLVAHVVAEAGRHPDTEALRRDLADRLPDFMVPGAFVLREALPRTANGKVDLKALQAEDVATAERRSVAPRNALEAELLEVWRGVLKVEEMGVGDNFFELGGDSIKAILAVSRVRKQLDVDLPAEALFAATTVAELARVVEEAREGGAGDEPDLVPVPRDGELPLSFAQRRLWYAQLLEPASAAYNVPHAFRLEGDLDVAAWRRSLRRIARRHEVLRTRFPTVDGEPRQVVAEEPCLPVPLVDLTALPETARGDELRRRVRREAWTGFDLAAETPVRALLLRLGEREHGALLTFHHIAFDGWSLGPLVHELSELYNGIRGGAVPRLPELPVQVADHAHWQRRCLRGERLERELDHWRRRLDGAPVLELPTDRPRPSRQSYRGGRVRRPFDGAVTDRLEELARREGGTLFMVLLTAYGVLLAQIAGQSEVVVGVPAAAHRERDELKDLIGLFLNTLPMRLDLSGNPTFRELLDRVRRCSLEAFAHQDVPFELLVDELRPERDLSRSPLFQAWFNHATGPSEPPAFEGLTLAPLEVEDTTIKFDLLLATERVGEELHASLGYSTDLFERGTAVALLAALEELGAAVGRRPELRYDALGEIVAAASRRQHERQRRERADSRQRSLRTVRRRGLTLEPSESGGNP